jgi:predicted PurR-regulated permease PerM
MPQILPEMTAPPDTSHSDRLQTTLWIAAGLAILALLYALSPILTPFLLAGILAYIGNPVADRLAGWGLPRMLAVILVMLALGALAAGLVLIILPLLYEEAAVLAARAPGALTLANEKLTPWLREHFGLHLRFDSASLQKFAAGNWDTVQVILERIYSSLKIGGVALFGLVVNLMLAPVVMFYLLLDWHGMLARLGGIIPRPWHTKLTTMANEIDAVLSQYLRGQILVMALLAAYYCAALWLAGIPSALSIGVVTGLLVFVPYLGYATGLILALLVATLQFAGWEPVIAVAIIYGFGQLLESFVLTPFLVGERIGLHPLVVIFALMAFGQLFGFFGVLAALPASAALLVGLREVRALYLASRFYRGQ